jgi:hypothetical protein
VFVGMWVQAVGFAGAVVGGRRLQGPCHHVGPLLMLPVLCCFAVLVATDVRYRCCSALVVGFPHLRPRMNVAVRWGLLVPKTLEFKKRYKLEMHGIFELLMKDRKPVYLLLPEDNVAWCPK